MGCEIIGLAQNGIQALEYSLSTPPDIVISDIVMPGIDGITFLRYLKENIRILNLLSLPVIEILSMLVMH